MIKLENINKSYSNQKVLENITLNIKKNIITGIIGPNGAGKSTLLKIIVGILNFDSGAIYLNQKRIFNFFQSREYLSYMPEQMQLYPEYFVAEFLKYYHNIIKYRDKTLFSSLELGKILNKKIKHLSKGWHQRLKLYLAMLNTKSLIILDEPFDGFDPLQMHNILKIIKTQKQKGKTFVISIHQLSYAKKICDFFILLDRGKIIDKGNLNYFVKKYQSSDIEDIFIKAIQQKL